MTTVYNLNGGIKVIQNNLLHCKLANSTLCHYFNKNNFDFALIQEPYVKNKRFINWNRLKGTMFTDISSTRPRTCIFAKQSTSYTAIAMPQFCNQDLTTVRVDYEKEGRRETVILASVYLPYEEMNPPSTVVQGLISFCQQHQTELIMGCDSNAHHTIWGSKDINPRGKSLSE